MNLKSFFIFFVGTVFLFPVGTYADLKDAKGFAVFKSEGCGSCHTIHRLDYPKKFTKSDEVDEGEDDDAGAPDLSQLSAHVMKDASPSEHLKGYLNKKIKHGSRKHIKKFKGSDEELDALVKFLLDVNKKRK